MKWLWCGCLVYVSWCNLNLSMDAAASSHTLPHIKLSSIYFWSKKVWVPLISNKLNPLLLPFLFINNCSDSLPRSPTTFTIEKKNIYILLSLSIFSSVINLIFYWDMIMSLLFYVLCKRTLTIFVLKYALVHVYIQINCKCSIISFYFLPNLSNFTSNTSFLLM